MAPVSNKKITVRLGLTINVMKRIDEIAYRAGVMRHVLIESAVEYVLKHKIDITEIAWDPAVKAFLNASKEDRISDTSIRIYPDIHKEIQKICKLTGLKMKDVINYATAYYIIYVLKVFNSESLSEHNVSQF